MAEEKNNKENNEKTEITIVEDNASGRLESKGKNLALTAVLLIFVLGIVMFWAWKDVIQPELQFD